MDHSFSTGIHLPGGAGRRGNGSCALPTQPRAWREHKAHGKHHCSVEKKRFTLWSCWCSLRKVMDFIPSSALLSTICPFYVEVAAFNYFLLIGAPLNQPLCQRGKGDTVGNPSWEAEPLGSASRTLSFPVSPHAPAPKLSHTSVPGQQPVTLGRELTVLECSRVMSATLAGEGTAQPFAGSRQPGRIPR